MAKGWLNKAVFSTIRVDMLEDGDLASANNEAWVEADFAEPVASLALVAQQANPTAKGRHMARRGARTALTGHQPGQTRTPEALSHDGGSNLTHLAEREGFEPSVSLPTTVFKTVTINHSVTSPNEYLKYFNR